MRISRILILLFAVFVGLYVIPYLIFRAPMEREAYDTHVTQNLEKIKAALNQSVEYRLCIYEGSFPFSSRRGRPRHYGGPDRQCDRCEDLYAAGLLTKSIEEYVPDVMEPTGEGNYQYNPPNMKKFDVQYELTDFGRSVYNEGGGDLARMPDRPRFCFGKPKLQKITSTQAPMMMGTQVAIGIQYIIEVENPHPFLFDPANKPLGLKLPKQGKVVLYPPENTTVMIYPGGHIELDSSVSYGPYVRQ